MAILYSTETAGFGTSPVSPPRAPAYGGRVKAIRNVITLASQTTSDAIHLGVIPAGAIPLPGVLAASASLGSSVVAIGTNSTHGSNGQLRAAATFTATDTPTFFGVVAGIDDTPYSSDTPIYLTIATANLPASGTLVVILYYLQP
jgi:hypothetical protein